MHFPLGKSKCIGRSTSRERESEVCACVRVCVCVSVCSFLISSFFSSRSSSTYFNVLV